MDWMQQKKCFTLVNYGETCFAQLFSTWCLMNGLIWTQCRSRNLPFDFLTSDLSYGQQPSSVWDCLPPQLWRHQRSVSQPCFQRVKWKVHNPLLIALPRAAEQPQLNTGQSWLQANLSNNLTSCLSPQRMLSDFSPQCPTYFDTSRQVSIMFLFTLAKWQKVDLNNTCGHLSFVSTCGNSEGFIFIFPVVSDKTLYLYNFPFSLQKYKSCVFSEFETFLHIWWSTCLEDTRLLINLTFDQLLNKVNVF